ncbi:MAG: DUF362 domain-containing protein [Candidatus Omnitrophota bacterium]
MKDRIQESHLCSRRSFLRLGLGLAAAGPAALAYAQTQETAPSAAISPAHLANAKVAIARCRTYGKEVEESIKKCFDLLGGVGSLVKGKTVAVKVNFTGSPYQTLFSKPPGETYLTHGATACALASILMAEGAKRVRFIECAYYKKTLEEAMEMVGWDVKSLMQINGVEAENTRNLGQGKKYCELKVPGEGYLFNSFQLNHSYEDADIFVSLNKLKNHETAGVTLSMKNMFGITPCSLYGDDAGSEDATQARGAMHGTSGWGKKNIVLPGAKKVLDAVAGVVVPRIVVDICAARPIHLAVIDGITSMKGGEGFWNAKIKPTAPGIVMAGLNPVSTDAVGTAVMGYANPRAERGTAPFEKCDNHLLLAERVGLGTADLSKIDVRGLSIEEARYPYNA